MAGLNGERGGPLGLLCRWGAAALLAVLPASALGQGGPPPEVRKAIAAVEQMLAGDDEASLRAFANDSLAPVYRDSFAPGALDAHLLALRKAAEGAFGDVRVMREPDGLHLTLSGQREAQFLLQLDGPGLITRLDLVEAGGTGVPPTPALSWSDLPEALRKAEADGFSGTVLAVQAGKEVLRAAYGLADRTSGRRTKLDDAYCIGSTPIDFTLTAVRLLAQRGQLRFDDPIGTHLPTVPADKRAMTIGHLMEGRSGLPDFHHVDGTDWDPDLAWIDRDTAIARILALPLRFPPGSDRAHSHSGYVLLAAIVERVGGQPYPEFLRKEVFAPAGMTRTGFYGESLGLGLADFAVGGGPQVVGVPNIPPNWGPTSWLVMGSGGMVSTLADLARYHAAIAAGRILTGPWREQALAPGVGLAGSDRGYFVLHADDGEGSSVLLLSNTDGRAEPLRALWPALAALVVPRAPTGTTH